MAGRVHIYLPSLNGGGAERNFVRLANFYAGAGTAVRLLVNAADGPLRPLLSDRVDLIDLGAKRARSALPKVARFLAAERPPSLLSALTINNLTALAARALSRAGTRIVISERNDLTTNLRRWAMPRRTAARQTVRLLYRHADAITAVSAGVARDLAGIAGVAVDRISVIHNPPPDGAEIAAARAAPSPSDWFGTSSPVIVAMGRLIAQKDYPTLIDAVAILRATHDARLIVLGDGPDLDALRARADAAGLAGQIRFQGFVMNRLDFLVRASVYVLSSRLEGFPNALIEAIACGVPVVSTDCAGAGPREILQHRLPRALVPVGDPPALAAAMREQLDQPPAPHMLEAIARDLTIERAAERYLALLDGAVTA